MRILLLAGMASALSACSGGGGEAENQADANQANVLTADNVVVDQNGISATGLDANAIGGTNAVDANMQNMMAQDANTNAPDTNLANGM